MQEFNFRRDTFGFTYNNRAWKYKNRIKNSIIKGKFPHASIIVGEDGIGKSIIAKEMAMIILEKSQQRSYADLIEFKPINKNL